MAFCGKCGASVGEGTRYCGNCGAAVGAAPATDAPRPVAGSAMASNVAALLAYVLGFITGIIFLVLEPYKNDRFVRFHAFQSIFVSIAFTIFWIFWNGIFWSFFWGAHFLWPIMTLVSTVVSLGAFVLWLVLMYKAYNNEMFLLPVIGEMAAKQAGRTV